MTPSEPLLAAPQHTARFTAARVDRWRSERRALAPPLWAGSCADVAGQQKNNWEIKTTGERVQLDPLCTAATPEDPHFDRAGESTGITDQHGSLLSGGLICNYSLLCCRLQLDGWTAVHVLTGLSYIHQLTNNRLLRWKNKQTNKSDARRWAQNLSLSANDAGWCEVFCINLGEGTVSCSLSVSRCLVTLFRDRQEQAGTMASRHRGERTGVDQWIYFCLKQQ